MTATPTEPLEQGTAPPTAAAPAPADPAVRLRGVDAARGLALLGMMAVHSLVETDDAGRTTVVSTVATGTAAALFAVLAGVGIAFTTGRDRVVVRRGAGDRRRSLAPTAASLAVRALAIGAIGLALGSGDVELAAVILPYYAVLFVLAVPLVLLGRRTLLALGGLLVVLAPAVSHLVRPALAAPVLQNPTLGRLVADPGGVLLELTVTGYYPAMSWLPYLCVGLAVGRMRLGAPRVAAALTGTGVALAALAPVVSDVLLGRRGSVAIAATTPAGVAVEGTTPTTTWWWLAVDLPHSSTPVDLARTVGTSLAVLGLMLLVGHLAGHSARVVALVQAPLAAAGSMTLTFYALHIAFLNSPFDTYSPGVGYLVQVVAVLVLGLGWRATAGRGPLEALVTGLGRAAARAVGPRATPA